MRSSILVLGFITAFIIFLSKSSTCVNGNSLEAGSFQDSSPVTTSNTKFRRRRYVVNSIEERADPNSPTVENANATSSTSVVATQSTNKKKVDQPEPISMVTIIALISAGGVIILIVIIFAFMRKRRLRKMANQAKIIDQQNNLYIEMKDNESQSYTAVATYTPNMGDELNIQLGDKVTILAEYDDGWVLGVNEARGGIKGIFPKHCVNLNNVLNYKRTSSIN